MSLGSGLPPELLARLAGAAAGPWADHAVPIATLDARSRPHPALLSYEELAARNAGTLRLCTYEGSTTTRNLRERSVVTLFLVAPAAVHYVKAWARELPGGVPGHPGLALFEARVDDVLVDRVDPQIEGRVEVVSGITVRRERPPAATRAALVGA